MAQLVERSLPNPEVCGSNPVIGKIYLYSTLNYRQLCIEKTKIKKKEAGNVPFFKKTCLVKKVFNLVTERHPGDDASLRAQHHAAHPHLRREVQPEQDSRGHGISGQTCLHKILTHKIC